MAPYRGCGMTLLHPTVDPKSVENLRRFQRLRDVRCDPSADRPPRKGTNLPGWRRTPNLRRRAAHTIFGLGVEG